MTNLNSGYMGYIYQKYLKKNRKTTLPNMSDFDIEIFTVDELIILRNRIVAKLGTGSSSLQKIVVDLSPDYMYKYGNMISREARDLFLELGGETYAKTIEGPYTGNRRFDIFDAFTVEYEYYLYDTNLITRTDPVFIHVVEQLERKASPRDESGRVTNGDGNGNMVPALMGCHWAVLEFMVKPGKRITVAYNSCMEEEYATQIEDYGDDAPNPSVMGDKTRKFLEAKKQFMEAQKQRELEETTRRQKQTEILARSKIKPGLSFAQIAKGTTKVV